MMASLTLKGIPEELLARLREGAARERRSLNGEVLMRLERSLSGQPGETADDRLKRVDAARARITGPLPTDEEIRAARDEGRR